MADLMELITLGTVVILIFVVYLRTRNSDQLSPVFESNQMVTETYQTMQEEYKGMQTVLSNVKEEITRSTEGRKEVIDFSRDLRDVLIKPSIRGDAAEKLLEDMCRHYLPDSAWERQTVTDEEATTQQGGVDVLLKTGSLNVPIDSKFPREAWKRYVNLIEEPMNGKSESEQKNHRNNIKKEFEGFQKAVMTQVGEIQKHINPGSGTTDFALMFIPTEAMYYAVVSDKNGINEKNMILRKGSNVQFLDAMLDERVVPVSPSTLYPFIHVIMAGIRNMKVVENLETLQQRLTQFETKMRTFTSAYDSIGTALNEAKSAWETAGSRYNELSTLGGKITNALEEVEVKETLLEASVEGEASDDNATSTKTLDGDQVKGVEND
ncbi:MAG: DNA recombination protein RmuC [Candidatus Poseidoniales archaeon]|jgi:DNA recombination protein RmuC